MSNLCLYNSPLVLSFQDPDHEPFQDSWQNYFSEDDFTDTPSDFPEYETFYSRFVKYRKRSPYHVKRSYDRGFFQAKTKAGTPAGLGGAWERTMLDRHLSEDLWLGMFCGSKTSQHNIDFDCKEHTIGMGIEYNTKWVFPVVAPPLSHFQQLKRIHDNFHNQLWCISSKTLGLHIWRKHKPHDSGRVHNAVKTSLNNIGLGHVEVHPMSGRCQRLPFGKDYITIVPDTVLRLWQDQVLYFEREEWETPSFDHIVRTLWSVAVGTHESAWKYPNDFNRRRGFEGVFEERRQEVMAWVDRGYKDVAVNIPAELVANVTHAASQQVDRGGLELRVPPSTAEAISAAAEYSGVRV
jgi:hypothetical protein